MSVYIWVVASIGYLLGLSRLVLLLSLAYKKALDGATASILGLQTAFWIVLSSIGFILVVTQ